MSHGAEGMAACHCHVWLEEMPNNVRDDRKVTTALCLVPVNLTSNSI